MKIKTKPSTYPEVLAMKRPKRAKPLRPNRLLQVLIRLLSIPTMLKTHFRYRKHGMEKIGKKEPMLILMNHSSFTRSWPIRSFSPSASASYAPPTALWA